MRKIEEKFENPIDNIIIKLGEHILPIFKVLGFTPNGLTTLSLIFGLLSIYSLFNKDHVSFSIFYFVSYFFDCIDGMMARKYNMVSKFGDMYDHAKDCLVFGLIIIILLNFYPILKNKILYFILTFSYVLSLVHLDCQEKIYDKNNESSFLSSISGFCMGKINDVKNNINFTKYFGVGTSTLILMVIPFYLES